MFVLLVGSVTAAVSTVVHAGGLSMIHVGDAAGLSIGVHHDASAAWDADRSSTFSTSTFAGARDFTRSGRTVRTFATRVAESFALGESVAFAAVDPIVLAGGAPGATPIGQLRADLLADLFGRYWSFASSGLDGSLAAAFQLAIWEIVHENLTGSTREDAAAQLTLDLGAFQASEGTGPETFSAYIHANLMLMSLGNGPFSEFANLRGLTDAGTREQLAAVIVPVPAPALLAAAGLFAAGSRRRSR